jgi:DNA invertase Pin-like site-specific DNA recombinase
MKPFVAYYRVSTERQGRSGLGTEAQRSAVARFAEAESLERIAEFTEIETGKGSDALDRRPQLAVALAAAKSAKCPVVVAKLDRLSRDVAFDAAFARRLGKLVKTVRSAWLQGQRPRRHSDGSSMIASNPSIAPVAGECNLRFPPI